MTTASVPRAAFVPIRQLRAHDYVAEQIRRHIALGLVAPGESFPSERELATMFGVGRPTVQRALRVLEADRLVDTRRGRYGGTFVSKASEDELVMDELIARVRRTRRELEDVLAYRQAVEPAAARAAAKARLPEDIAALNRALEQTAAAANEHEYMRADTELHLAVAGATRNRFLEQAIEEIRIHLNDAMALLPESDIWHRRIDEEHRAVVEAIAAGDEEAAEAAMSLHAANAEQGLRAVLAAVERYGGKDSFAS
jgi:GntR family transcriptional repressor for pyruvate dehydrogenase complex